MNPILQIKLRFRKEPNNQKPGDRKLKSSAITDLAKISNLIENLKSVLRFYRGIDKIIQNILIDVNYNDIIAKSNRIRELLKPKGKTTNDMVVGARFSQAPENEENHIITYYVDVDTINNTIKELETAYRFINENLNGQATADNFNESNRLNYDGYGLSKTKLRDIVIDCSVVDSFAVPNITDIPEQDSFLVTFYKTEIRISAILEKLKIDEMKYRYNFCGNDTISVTRELYDILKDRIPYMISMISSDLSKISLPELNIERKQEEINIPNPVNEPTIGVIDTLFNENVYFSNWVNNTDYLDDIERITTNKDDLREHGTQVCSIIVDGPRLNPWLDDGCGRFRVRHFGVCSNRISTAKLSRKIKEIVTNNPDIHVWNLSLGNDEEVSRNFISYDAAVLDEIQAKHNVIFVISGTNDNRAEKNDRIRIGAPADSLNSLVVNSVTRDGKPTSYSRKGNILSFFQKPDVCYYGGDFNERLIAYSIRGEEEVYGTSFAAPWISRKLSYLIDVMGISREIAKALIIDSAAGWDYKSTTYKDKDLMGYGIVPISINNVLSSDSDEIKFVVYGTSESYKTTNYQIPIPRDEENKYPYIARAAICYFPECSRVQGVDYTNRELSLQFGRLKSNGKIQDINENVQDEPGVFINERLSRKEFRKWENTKFISKVLKQKLPTQSYKSYNNLPWGIAITSKERLSTKTGNKLNFGAVITLKEIKGVNRIQDFIHSCILSGYIINEINIQNQIEIYNSNQEEIIFD